MTTKAQIKEELKALHPTLQIGNDEDGYTQLDAKAYDATIAAWAENQYQAQAAETAAAEKLAAKQAVLAKLGLTAEEAAALIA